MLKPLIYFLSDFHFSVSRTDESQIREKKIIHFLESIESQATDIFLVGDIFDFWFEYRYVVPKGYVRFLGTLARLSDKGIQIHYFAGNHDMWLREYFTKELGAKIYFKPQEFTFNNKTFLVGHGDGLGSKQFMYKFLKTFLFKNKFLYYPFLYFVHPDWFIPLGKLWSEQSHKHQKRQDQVFLGEEKEFLISYCKKYLIKRHINFFIFGHRHLPLELKLKNDSTYINTGDMISYNTYAYFDGNQVFLKKLT